jgi:site-specific DNA-cytosine methylase
MEDAGFRVEYMVDKKKVCCQTLEDNTDRFHVNAKVFNADVREFLQRCRDRVPGYPSAADVDHVHASPPCQGFSKANR